MRVPKNSNKITGRKAVSKAIARQEAESPKSAALSQEEIRQAICEKAYELYQQRGGQHGNDVADWLRAEQMVLKQSAI